MIIEFNSQNPQMTNFWLNKNAQEPKKQDQQKKIPPKSSPSKLFAFCFTTQKIIQKQQKNYKTTTENLN